MKSLKNKESVEKLNETLLKKTGIDFASYKKPELLGSITDLILFPKYAFFCVIKPIIIIFLLIIFSSIISVFYGKIIFAVLLFFIGLTFGLLNGISFGVSLFVKRISDDIQNIFKLSLDLVKNILSDLETTYSKAKNGEFKFPKISEIIYGVFYIIVLPTVTSVINKKIKFVGGII